MKKNLSKEIQIPEGIEVKIEGNKLTVKGPEGENSRKFNLGKVNLEKKDDKIILGYEKSTKRDKKTINTTSAHISNMIKGARKKFEYKLKICSSHFPISVKIEGNRAIIKNFLGEKVDREVKIPKGAEIKIEKEIITISSIDKEFAGQAAANFEAGTRITNRDKRIFQDGIYIINKAGEKN